MIHRHLSDCHTENARQKPTKNRERQNKQNDKQALNSPVGKQSRNEFKAKSWLAQMLFLLLYFYRIIDNL